MAQPSVSKIILKINYVKFCSTPPPPGASELNLNHVNKMSTRNSYYNHNKTKCTHVNNSSWQRPKSPATHLFKSLFSLSTKTSKLCIKLLALYEGKLLVTGGFSSQRAQEYGKCFHVITSSWGHSVHPGIKNSNYFFLCGITLLLEAYITICRFMQYNCNAIEVTLKYLGKVVWSPNTAKHHKVWNVCIIGFSDNGSTS